MPRQFISSDLTDIINSDLQDITVLNLISVEDIVVYLNSDESSDEENRLLTNKLQKLLRDIAGYGGDFEYAGVWYPQFLIAEFYFPDYIEELAGDLGYDLDAWPYRHIDWQAAADEALLDYADVHIEDYRGNLVTYYYR